MSITQHDLDQFTGSTDMFRHWTRQLHYTTGVHYLCENGTAWLIDAIASHQFDPKLKTGDLKHFQIWELEVTGESALLTCRPDSDAEPAVSQEIEYTDFPLPSIKLYVELGSLDGVNEHLVCMLHSER